jgi:hypothetical protein
MINPHVSSAVVEYAVRAPPRPADTTTPCSVQAATSMWNPLLREQHRVAPRHLLDHAPRLGVGVGVHDHVVTLQPLERARRAKHVGVVVNHRDLHGPPP